MENEVIKYYNQDFNCAECMLMAAKDCYKIDVSDEMTDMCGLLSNGMGIGSFCAALSVTIMLFGKMFDTSTAKRMRIRLLSEFRELYPNFNCAILRGTALPEGDCEKILTDIGRLMDKIVKDC